MPNKILVIIIIITAIASCNSKKSNEGAEAQLLKLNNEYDSALVRADTGVLKRLYAEDFVYTNPEGKLLNREQQINSIAVSEVKLLNGRSEDVKVKIYNNSAVMTGAFVANGTYRGNPLAITERFTVVWIRTDTSWKMVAEQGNIVQ